MSAHTTQNASIAGIEELLEEIRSLTIGENWRISLEQALGFVEQSREEYYQFAYARLRRSGVLEISDYFSRDNAGDLIQFLGNSIHPEAESLFFQAGYYFNEGILQDWREFFISVAMSRMLSEAVDREELEISLAGCRLFQDAALFYCHSVFNTEELIQFSLNLFLEKSGAENHALSRFLLREDIRYCLDRRLIRWEDLYRTVFRKLHDKAASWRILNGTPFWDEEFQRRTLSGEVKEALQVLEFTGAELPDKESLRKRYRGLMKKYHPDINPEGLEKARKINEAYTLALGEACLRAG